MTKCDHCGQVPFPTITDGWLMNVNGQLVQPEHASYQTSPLKQLCKQCYREWLCVMAVQWGAFMGKPHDGPKIRLLGKDETE